MGVQAPLSHLRAEAEFDMGAAIAPGGVRFRVWAPVASRVEVELLGREGATYHPLERGEDGVFSAFVPGAAAGNRYRFRLDGEGPYPDPCSRFQPEGVHGPSEIVDPAFDWRDADWRGPSMDGLVIYECHVGTYTPEGTFEALIPQLPQLRRLGVNALELMPVAEFSGSRNWGYDGVDLYAPSRNYGGGAGLKRLVDAAHRQGVSVLLDVVYNHLGPEGNYLRVYNPDYFTTRHKTPWGDALNFDGPDSHLVRELVIQNACYWLTEYHLDGLRLDATHAIIDDSHPHLVAELAERARSAAGDRQVLILAENDSNDVRLIRPLDEGGFGLDGVWADDFHHSLRVFLTGRREGYFEDYAGTVDEIARAIEKGFVYQGEVSPRLGRPRGNPVSDEPAASFIFCTQNHDQIGNQPFGDRLNHLVSPEMYAVASLLLLIVPETPMLFMGQEFAASSPFLYFTDHGEELGRLVTQGRREEFFYMEGFRDPAQRARVPDPQAEETFLRSKLRLSERWEHYEIYRLYGDALRLRRTDPVLSERDRNRTMAVAAGERILAVLRWTEAGSRLLLANFGPETSLPLGAIVPESWQAGRPRVLLHTGNRRYGGSGARVVFSGTGAATSLRIPAATGVVLGMDRVPAPQPFPAP